MPPNDPKFPRSARPRRSLEYNVHDALEVFPLLEGGETVTEDGKLPWSGRMHVTLPGFLSPGPLHFLR